WTLLSLHPVRVRFIQVLNRVQALEPCPVDVPHSEIGVQRLLEAERGCSRIPDHQLQGQHGPERGTMGQTKVRGPPSLRMDVAFGEHADRNDIPGLLDRIELPRRRAHESMRRCAGIVRFAPEPGEADGYAAPNGTTVLPACPGADEQDFLRAA